MRANPSNDSSGQRFAGEHVMPTEAGNDDPRANEASPAAAEEATLFGSWQIDQRTGLFSWSDEVFRIFGFDPQTFTPSYEAVLARTHTPKIAHGWERPTRMQSQPVRGEKAMTFFRSNIA